MKRILVCYVTSKNCAYRDSNSDCLSQVRRSAGLSIPGRDTYYMSCSVFICALRSLIALSNPFHYSYLLAILLTGDILPGDILLAILLTGDILLGDILLAIFCWRYFFRTPARMYDTFCQSSCCTPFVQILTISMHY